MIWLFFLGPALTAPFFFAPLWRQKKLRILWPALAASAISALVVTNWFPHYMAASTGIFFLLSIQALRFLRARNTPLFHALMAVFLVTCALGIALEIAQRFNYTRRSPPGWCCNKTVRWERDFLLERMQNTPGKHLLIVRYALHEPLPAWVYNRADIDASNVIFARDFGACGNGDLLRYYADRQKWLVLVDGYDYEVRPYPEHELCAP